MQLQRNFTQLFAVVQATIILLQELGQGHTGGHGTAQIMGDQIKQLVLGFVDRCDVLFIVFEFRDIVTRANEAQKSVIQIIKGTTIIPYPAILTELVGETVFHTKGLTRRQKR